ncbi:MAG TPA: hypothetical protein VHI52_15635, partial [Verrucomicrobiae bacterium]|nr:hypothetical protein [Verrucomicrobiae bacterium]
MKIWKASFAATLLVLSLACGASAETVTLASGGPGTNYAGYPPPYGTAQPYQGPMVPGQVQQYYNNVMAPPGTIPPGQQQAAGMYGNNSGQPQQQVQYHYKNPNPSIGGVPED